MPRQPVGDGATLQPGVDGRISVADLTDVEAEWDRIAILLLRCIWAAPAYLGNAANVDPEEAFVAALASCHMLTFLSIACKQKFVLDSYEDEAVGHMEKNADGKLAITRVELHPKIAWSGNQRPSEEELDKMHHVAHENCFIANSVKTNGTVAKP